MVLVLTNTQIDRVGMTNDRPGTGQVQTDHTSRVIDDDQGTTSVAPLLMIVYSNRSG